MQLTPAGGGCGGGGLARFRSAPATWLDALLEDDDSLKLAGPHQGGLTQLLTAGTSTTTTTTTTTTTSTTTSAAERAPPAYIQPAENHGVFNNGGGAPATNNAGFYRMNSSPADFLSANVDSYFSSYGNLDFGGGSSVETSGKRMRDSDSSDFANHRRGELSGLLDMDMEKLLEDSESVSVPCRVRAKRGCATHPRSIAERVRRTRISDRIRKLQELVPNMDKQTNTADMLDEAVEYVKTLQRQIQELTDQQKKCTCSGKG